MPVFIDYFHNTAAANEQTLYPRLTESQARNLHLKHRESTFERKSSDKDVRDSVHPANAGSKSAIPLSENEAKGFLRRKEPGIMRRDNEQGEYGETGDTQEFGEQNEQDEQ
ncbi:hypothetical protein ACROYT_G030776 [Oculina patagonica]